MTTCQTHWWPGHHGHYGHHVSSVCPMDTMVTMSLESAPGLSGDDPHPRHDNYSNCHHHHHWYSQGQSQSWIGFRARCNYWDFAPPRDGMRHMELWWKHNNSSGSLPELVSSPSLCSTQLSIFCIIHKNFHQSPPSQISWAAIASHCRKALDTSIQVLSDTTCFWWQFYILAPIFLKCIKSRNMKITKSEIFKSKKM